MQYHDETSTSTYLLKGMAGEGGEGSVYEVDGHPELIAKMYNEERLAQQVTDPATGQEWNMLGKITHMSHKELSPWVDEGGDRVLAIAWPQKTLFDDHHNFVGFLMPRIEVSVPGEDCPADIHFAYRERERKYLFGEGYTWLTSVKIAMNLATVVRYLHENDVIIGDFNCNNILVDGDAHVMLIDADSFCISNPVLGITYRCIVGVGEFIAPELQGQDLASPTARRGFTKESDCFSLAIHIFELLMGGTHPFSGRKEQGGYGSSSTEPYVHSIAAGRCPYVTGSDIEPFEGSLPITMLPYEVREMFDRAFSYDEKTAVQEQVVMRRPSAREWEAVLRKLYQESLASTKACPLDPSHKSHPVNSTCPWCGQEGLVTPLKPVSEIEAAGRRPRRLLGKLVAAVAVAGVVAATLMGFRACSTPAGATEAGVEIMSTQTGN